MSDLKNIWEVQASIPPEEGKSHRRNRVFFVVTVTAQRSLEVVLEHYPGAEVHQCIQRGYYNHEVLLDMKETA